jgi:hypothetical protein
MDDFMDQGLEKEKKKKSKVKKLISSVVDFKKKQNLEMDNSDLPSTVPEEIEYEQDENGRLQTEVKKGIKQMLKQKAGDTLGLITPKQAAPNMAQWQHKPYCQICFAQFNRLTLTPHHCRECGRTCCKDCSVKR